jgi:hypothetical protein
MQKVAAHSLAITQDEDIFDLSFMSYISLDYMYCTIHCKKRFVIFPSPAVMSLTKLSLGGNNDVIYKLFPPKESLVSDIPAGDGKIVALFLQCCMDKGGDYIPPALPFPHPPFPPGLRPKFHPCAVFD